MNARPGRRKGGVEKWESHGQILTLPPADLGHVPKGPRTKLSSC